MSEQPLKPLKKRGSISPVLIELAIVILFFAISTSIAIRLIAAASAVSEESAFHARALIAMESVAEEIKANPEDGAFDEYGSLFVERTVAQDLTVRGVVTRDDSPENGVLYAIDLSVHSENGKEYTLSALRYVSDGEALP